MTAGDKNQNEGDSAGSRFSNNEFCRSFQKSGLCQSWKSFVTVARYTFDIVTLSLPILAGRKVFWTKSVYLPRHRALKGLGTLS